MSNAFENADKIQGIINDDLFPNVQNVSDVKQVLEFMEGVGQSLSQEQVRALILLEQLGGNKRLHGDKNPYKPIIDKIIKDFKYSVAPTAVYLDTMEQLIPKPPRPIIMADKVEKAKK
jgi:hypothetical protein